MDDFAGVKIALFYGEKLLVFLRDDKPGLRFANMWDFPGGGREGSETPFECIQREVDEEFSIRLEPTTIVWQKEFPAMHDASQRAYFMAGQLTKGQVEAIRFGSEGQRWEFMAVDEFFSRNDVVPHLKERFQTYLREVTS